VPLSIQELERRVEKDPASIAFAQLADEYRRAGMYEEAVRVARAGLARHPGYLSARVTLGRALVELDELDAAKIELDAVLRSAPENLAAIRALADIHQRRGDTPALSPVSEPALPAPKAPDPVPPMVPEETPVAHEPERSPEATPQQVDTSLESLGVVTFELPESEPAASSEHFNLANFRIDNGSAQPDDDAWSLDNFTPERDPAPSSWRKPVEPSPQVTSDELEMERPLEPVEPAVHEPPTDPTLVALEQWLGALMADRAERKRS
jgi:tetratricopeptide (TPR) repeat protein